jgi:hypothetical protein
MSSTNADEATPLAQSIGWTRVYFIRAGAQRPGWTMPLVRVPEVGEKVSLKCTCTPPEGQSGWVQDEEGLLLMTCRWWEVVEVCHAMLCEPTENGFHKAGQTCWVWVKALPDYQPPEQ